MDSEDKALVFNSDCLYYASTPCSPWGEICPWESVLVLEFLLQQGNWTGLPQLTVEVCREMGFQSRAAGCGGLHL